MTFEQYVIVLDTQQYRHHMYFKKTDNVDWRDDSEGRSACCQGIYKLSNQKPNSFQPEAEVSGHTANLESKYVQADVRQTGTTAAAAALTSESWGGVSANHGNRNIIAEIYK